MSLRKRSVAAGLLGIIIAFGVIAGAAYIVPLNASQATSTNQVNLRQTSSSSQPSSSQSTTGQSQASQSQASESQTTGSSAEAGTVDVLLTDPPTLPTGVTAVYVTYSNVAVHVSGAGNSSGWTNSNTHGTLNIVKLVNVSSTIAAIKVSAGVYNELRFNISSAAVTYNAKNYTAFVQGAVLVVPIPGGIPVNATNTSAAIVDLQPTVVNIGSDSTPEFIITTAATGYCIPSSSVTGSMGQQGNLINLITSGWWQKISESSTADLSITGATLKSGSLSVEVKNTGTASINLTAIFVAPLGNECPTTATTTSSSSTSTTSSSSTSTSSGKSTTTTSSTTSSKKGGSGGMRTIPTCFTGSANYVVLNNGTLVPINSALPLTAKMAPSEVSWALFGKTGYELAAGQSVTLTYSGSITFGLGVVFRNMVLPGVISGDQYDIGVLGLQALAETIVVAS